MFDPLHFFNLRHTRIATHRGPPSSHLFVARVQRQGVFVTRRHLYGGHEYIGVLAREGVELALKLGGHAERLDFAQHILGLGWGELGDDIVVIFGFGLGELLFRRLGLGGSVRRGRNG